MNKSSLLPMNCAAIRNKLSALEDGEVAPALRFEIETHLAVCSDCRQAQSELHHLWQVMEAAIPPPPRPDFSQEIMGRLTVKKESRLINWGRAFGFMFPTPTVMAVIVVLGLLIGGWVGRTAMEGKATIATAQGQAAVLEAMDVFTPVPKGSLAQSYILLVSDATQVKR